MGRVLPILFNTDMVRAILDGRKTVTRRLMKPQLPSSCPTCHYVHNEFIYDLAAQNVYCARCGEPLYNGGFPYKAPYHPGDILYVRETWSNANGACGMSNIDCGECHSGCGYLYKATPDDCFANEETKWRPSIFMPKEAARIWLKVTDVKVERLQDITIAEIIKEGCADLWIDAARHMKLIDVAGNKNEFTDLWNLTIKKNDLPLYGWSANPWVWRIKFERCEKPEGV